MNLRAPSRSRMWLQISLCCVVLLGALDAQAVKPTQAAIASAHPLATQAGLDILKQGGNAFDAAVAVTAALAVVEPQSSGLGGGGFYLLHRASDGRNVFVDARETAPAAATRDLFLDAQGNVIRGASTNTALAAGIPGEVAAMAHLAKRYGKLSLAKSLRPAITLARDGFPLYERMRGGMQFSSTRLAASKDASENFLNNGAVPDLGFVIKQPQLARTLNMIAQRGAASFYTGRFAHKLVVGVKQLGGIWSDADLATYKVIERRPIEFDYQGNHIVSAPPPSSGGVALAESLNVLSGFDLTKQDNVTRDHLIIEAMRRAYHDRAEYLGDPDFVNVPLAMLTSNEHTAELRSTIRLERATPSSTLPAITGNAEESNQTTHFSILDRDGNRVAATITVNLGFGSGLMVDGTGFFLNNEMDDFSIKPGTANSFQLVGAEANAIAPSKRMLSSMTPSFVENKDGVLIIGTPGGSRIISMVLLGMLDWMDGNDAAHVASRKRFHHQYLPDEVSFEPGAFSAEEQQQLQQRGHVLKEMRSGYGNMQVVTWDKTTGKVAAASDPRGDGVGWVY
jgi:gamma-glutamyltranspeptidase / glutathione hydrolase